MRKLKREQLNKKQQEVFDRAKGYADDMLKTVKREQLSGFGITVAIWTKQFVSAGKDLKLYQAIYRYVFDKCDKVWRGGKK